MRPVVVGALAYSLIVLSALAQRNQNPEGPAAVNLPPAVVAGEIQGDRVSNPEKQGDWPAIAYTKDGSLWAIWIEWNDKDADRVLLRRRDPQGKWGGEIVIEDGNWDHYSPAIVAVRGGVVAILSRQSDGNYDPYSAPVSPSGGVSKTQPPTTAPLPTFHTPHGS